MRNNLTGRILSTVSSLLLSAILLAGCAGSKSSQTAATASHPVEASMPWKLSFSFPDGAPPLNREAELLCTVAADTNVNGVSLRVWVVLPEALQLVSGNLSWEGRITANPGDRIPTVKAVVRSVKVGNWEIRVHAYLPESTPEANFVPQGHPVFVSISKDKAA